MAGVDKAAFMRRLSAKAPAGDEPIPGAAPTSEMTEHTPDEPLSCGEQLMRALDSGDASAVDDALKEAVKKYGSGGEGY